MKVIKHSGEAVDFNLQKLRNSLSKSGASPEKVDSVIAEILPKIQQGDISTSKLYSFAHSLLKKHEPAYAARYSLKRALQELGPDGYFFEKWIGKIFEEDHYHVLTSQILKGNAVNHEIDVLAEKNKKITIIECKFRNTPDAKISVTTPMYFLSRVNDLKGNRQKLKGIECMIQGGCLVTNALLTVDSIQFSEYYGLDLISWDYPQASSIKKRVDHACLYPITCLSTLNHQQKRLLLEKNCILVKDLLQKKELLSILKISNQKAAKILNEAIHLVQVIKESVNE